MNHSSARPADAIEPVIRTYSNTLYRLCFLMLRQKHDAEDAVQETFFKYLQKAPQFETPDHEKAWLITVATNQCLDILRFRKRHPHIDFDTLQTASAHPVDSGILDALMALPEKFRIVLTLYYIEEYRTDEIAPIIGKTPSAVKMRLRKGRRLLEELYRKEYL